MNHLGKFGKLFIALTLSLFCLSGLAFAEQEYTITDKGYKVFNSSPQPNESVTWSGNTDSEGFASGEGILQWFINGKPTEKYEGGMLKGKLSGRGINTWGKGHRYEGAFVNGMRSGKGIYTSASGFRYEGEWNNSKYNGKGSWTRPNGESYKGDFVNGNAHGTGIATYVNGDRYEGDFVNDQRNGKGVYTFANGKRSAGIWENGKLIGAANTTASGNRAPASAKRAPIPSGEYSPYIGGSGWRFTDKGHMVFDEMIAADQSVTWTGGVDSQGYASGEGILCWYSREGKFFKKYEGTLLKGKRNGKGIETSPSEDGKHENRFEGAFVNDQKEGKGVSVWYEYGQRNSYEGDFVNDRWHGKGVRVWGNGDRYEGSFVKSKLTGYGILTLASGTVYEGEFIDGRRVLNQEEIAAKYPVGTKVEVVQWKRLFDSYGYAGIVRENDGSDVTLEVIAFINVNNDVEAAPASGGKRLVKGQDIGTLVTTSMRNITGYYKGDIQANSTSPMNLAGDYTIENQYDSSDNKMRIYSLKCSETGAWAEVLYFYNPQSYTWRTFDKKNRHWPEYNTSFHQVAVKACRGIVD